jgi:hypothetical protein
MSVYVPVKLRRQLREKFHDRCAYCQSSEALMAVTFEFEHITPLSAGGKNAFENLCLACPTCNRRKASRRSGIDPVTGERVDLFHPQNDVWCDHFSWNETATEIIPLTPTGKITIDFLQMNRRQIIIAREMWVDVGRHPPM